MIRNQFISPCLFCLCHCLPGTSPVWLLHYHYDHPHHQQLHNHDHGDHHDHQYHHNCLDHHDHHDHPHHHQPHHHDHHDHHRLTATPPATPLKTSASSASLSACPSILPACSNRPDQTLKEFPLKLRLNV